MLDATSIATRYIAVWNEKNADRRRDLLAKIWAIRHYHRFRQSP